MIATKTAALLVALGLASNVAAHGHITNCTVNGMTYEGYNPFGWEKATTKTVGWKIPEDTDNGFIKMDNINSEDIICHKGATPGELSVLVKPGDTVRCQWQKWPVGHHGAALNYLANCNGDCTKVDKTTLKFNKMTELGLIHPMAGIPIGKSTQGGDPKSNKAGYWAGDQLTDNGEIFEFPVPTTIATGSYILRQEKIALHDAAPGWGSGAQPIPQCINLIVENSSGQDAFTGGTLGVELYKKTEPGFNINIWMNPASYLCPGPPVYSGSGSDSNGTPAGSNGTPTDSNGTPESTPSSTATPSSTPTPYSTGSPSSVPKPYETPSGYTVPKPSPMPKPHSGPHSYSHHGTSSGEGQSKYTGTTDSTTPPSSSSGTFPDLTKLSISDLLNLIEKIISALKSKYGITRRHARDVLGA